MDVTQNILMQNILLLGSAFGLIVSIILLTRHGNKKGYIIAPLTYFINAFLFYLAIELKEYGVFFISLQQLLLWSTIVRLHSLIIILTYLLVEPKRS